MFKNRLEVIKKFDANIK